MPRRKTSDYEEYHEYQDHTVKELESRYTVETRRTGSRLTAIALEKELFRRGWNLTYTPQGEWKATR